MCKELDDLISAIEYLTHVTEEHCKTLAELRETLYEKAAPNEFGTATSPNVFPPRNDRTQECIA